MENQDECLYIPTLRELIDKYKEIAKIELSRNGKPSKHTQNNAVNGTKSIISVLDQYYPREDGVSWLDVKYNELTRKVLTKYVDKCVELKSLKKISIQTSLLQLAAVTAKWTVGYYDDINWDVTPFNRPRILKDPKRYKRPTKETLKRVFNWYNLLETLDDKRYWVFATMMLQFGMRNGDVLRLTKDNFVEEDGQIFLHYTPHKTKLSSGRVIKWPIHNSIWEKLENYIDEIKENFTKLMESKPQGYRDFDSNLIIPYGISVIAFLNKTINDAKLFDELDTYKSLYELRKICVDHIYEKYGAEMASSISGDDIKTVMKYYADPSQVNVSGGIVITNML